MKIMNNRCNLLLVKKKHDRAVWVDPLNAQSPERNTGYLTDFTSSINVSISLDCAILQLGFVVIVLADNHMTVM